MTFLISAHLASSSILHIFGQPKKNVLRTNWRTNELIDGLTDGHPLLESWVTTKNHEKSWVTNNGMLKHYFPITIPQKYSFHWFLFLLAKFFLMNQDSVLFICHPFGSHYASIFLTQNSLLLITLSLITLSQSRYWQSVCMLSNQSMKSFSQYGYAYEQGRIRAVGQGL